MSRIEVTVLGSNSAIPAHGRHPSAQWIGVGQHTILMDCGEGTQFQIIRYQLKLSKLDLICISHLHGDHCYGLPGLLTTMSLGGRTRTLKLFGPIGVKQWLVKTLEYSGSRLGYPLEIIELQSIDSQTCHDAEDFSIVSFPLKHRVPTRAFVFVLKQSERPLDGQKAEKDGVPFHVRGTLKKGLDYQGEEGAFLFEDYTSQPTPELRYAYCSDTVFDPDIVPFITQVHTLYHEATYDRSLSEQATERFHSTAEDAATIAKSGQVQKLLLGHSSSRYKDVLVLEREAQTVFPASEYVAEGQKYIIE